MPSFLQGEETLLDTERRLLRRYLQKNHNYRYKGTPYPTPDKVIVSQSFGYDAFDIGATIYAMALRMSSRSFGIGSEPIMEGDFFAAQPAEYLWGMMSGSGLTYGITRTFDSMGQPVIGSTSLLASSEPYIAFYMIHGSYFTDWNAGIINHYGTYSVQNADGLVKALLATPTYGLAVFPNSAGYAMKWHVENLAQGDTLGNGILRTINTQFEEGTSPERWLCLFGDPTLRTQTIYPASGGSWNPTTTSLSWNASAEGGPNLSYLVEYSTTGLLGTWITLGETSATSIGDGSSGSRLYRIRAKKLISTGSGSFYNLSQGIFVQR